MEKSTKNKVLKVFLALILIIIMILVICCGRRDKKINEPNEPPLKPPEPPKHKEEPIKDFGEPLTELSSGTHQLSIKMQDNKNTFQEGIQVERHYLVHLPTGFNPNNNYDLVVFFHGTTGTSQKSLQDTEFDDLANQENFIMVFPQGMGTSNNINEVFTGDNIQKNTCWNIRPDAEPDNRCYASSRKPDDDKFINGIITKFNNELNINKLFVSGFSNGCGMAQHIGLTRIDINAIGIGGCSVPGQDFLDRRKSIPVLRFHATDDPVSEYMSINEELPQGIVPTAELAIDGYADLNDCSKPADKEELNIGNFEIEHWTYPNCKEDTEFYKIEGGSHIWYSAITPIVWDFFEKN
ncbi:MAG: hypothetical protein MAG795_00250 [Candidatus Woesearchaeota archaeon]|nr:hypothetical protein [Candidatus Woesearchaeota archaeon]